MIGFRRTGRSRVLALLFAAATLAGEPLSGQEPPHAANGPALKLPPAEAKAPVFTSSPTLQTEAATLVKLLDIADYNHAAVTPADYGEVVPDYMGDNMGQSLDSQHMFFLDSDKAKFMRKYNGETLYSNVAYIGNIDAAYEIYYVFRDRVEKRVAWIDTELNGPFSFDGNDTYPVDRSKAEWPATAADADDLWRRRLKFELLDELLNKKTLDQAKDIVRKRYDTMSKNIDDLDGGNLSELFLTCIAGLYDPHSSYLSADSFENFSIQMKLQLVGIGAMLKSDGDYCTVEELVPGGPADLGHLLKPHDKIIAVGQDGQAPVEIIGMNIQKVVDMIRGKKGTRVHLIVHPASATDASAQKEIIITRDIVKLNAERAHAAVFQVPGSGGAAIPMGVITLPEFYNQSDDPDAAAADKYSASQDTAALIVKLKAAGIKALVLDLRHNGGGFLTEAINVAGLFIPRGPVVQVKQSDGSISVGRDDAPGSPYTGPLWDGPLAVLTDRFSASASEIVAGALQNYGRAIVIGDSSTHGKGTVQQILSMKDVSPQLADAKSTGAAKITIQKFYLPNGSSTQLKGVVPDISLPSEDDYLNPPIGESSLPHALIWDRIPSSIFNGRPLDPKIVDELRQDSETRQASLEEFSFLRKAVDWFKAREEEKLVSLNLDERQKEKAADDAFKKAQDAELDALAKADDYPHQEFWLGPPPPPKPKPDPSANSDDSDDSDADAVDAEEDTPYPKMDVHLRETFRVLSDAIDLGRNKSLWAGNHPPLTIADKS